MASRICNKSFFLITIGFVLSGCVKSIEDYESQIVGSWKVDHDGRVTCTQFNSDKTVVFGAKQLEPEESAANVSQGLGEGRWWFDRGGRLWTETAANRGLEDESLNVQRLGYYIKSINNSTYVYVSMQSDRTFEAQRVDSCE